MKLQTSQNTYIASNCSLYISDDLKTIDAYSYSWWKFVTVDSVGNVYFINSTYSNSTSGHQSNVGSVLNRLSISVDLQLNKTTQGFCRGNSIKDVLSAEITCYRSEIKELISAIRKKGSWKKTNIERRETIKHYLYKIKDLRNIRDNYVDQKRIPYKKVSFKDICKESKYTIARFNKYKRLYFKKDNGKTDINGFISFIDRLSHYGEAPTNLQPLMDLLNLKKQDVETLLLYRFSNDLCGMLPGKDAPEYGQVKQWIKRQDITRENLTTLSLDKLHEYLTNKQNRKDYTPRDPEALPVHPVLQKLEGLKDLLLIKTDHDLRREGRQQSHCIGSKQYLERCQQGYQALRYKGHTFFFDPTLRLVEAHGKRNAHTPREIIGELSQLIEQKQTTMQGA